MTGTAITLLMDMCAACRGRAVPFVEKLAAREACGELSLRLVGCGLNKASLRPLVSAQGFTQSPSGLGRQLVELLSTPFAEDRGGIAEGLGLAMSSVGGDDARHVVIVVTDRPEASLEAESAQIERLRSLGVLVRCVSPEAPEAVVGVMKERGGGYVRIVERRGGMTILARYSCQFGPREREFSDYVVGELLAFKDSIDIERFVRPVPDGGWGWSCQRVFDLYNDVLWNNPQIFYVNKRCSVRRRVDSAGGAKRHCIEGYTYAIGADDFARCRAELEAASRAALAEVEGVPDPVDRAKILHDYIVRNCEYDTRGMGNPRPEYRNVYDVLVRHVAVCEGYVMAYRHLLALAGIESEEVISGEMGHCWSYLHLNGHWYHVDVTWDDPQFEGKKADYVSHRYFLLSDAAIRAKKHHDWDVRGLPPADDATYDRRKWG